MRYPALLGVTAVPPVITMPVPPTARLPKWMRYHSVAGTLPSSQEYWDIDETVTRLRAVTSRTSSV